MLSMVYYLYTPRMVMVLAAAGLVTLLLISRRTRPIGFVVLGLLLPFWFYARMSASSVSLGTTKTTPATLAPGGFEPSAEQLRHARMFPSVGQAAAQLTARIAESLSVLPEGRGEPARIAVSGPAEIRPHVAAALRSAFPRSQQSFDVAPTTRPISADAVQLRLEVIADPPAMGQSPSAPRRGVVRAIASGAGGTLEESVQFIDKPWAGEAGTAYLTGSRRAIVARSLAPCTSAAEALAQARQVAAAELRPLVIQYAVAKGCPDIESDELWFTNHINAAVNGPGFIQDEFFQELAMTYGSVFRASVLVSTSADKIDHLGNQLIIERRRNTVHTLSTGAAIAALSLLIFLVYLFLNMVTRGYFTLRLRLAAIGLFVAAVLLVIMVA